MRPSNPYSNSGLNSDLINQRLKALKLTNKQLAHKMGVSQYIVSAVKTGRESPSLVMILKMAKILHVHPLDICRIDYFSELLSGYPYCNKKKSNCLFCSQFPESQNS